MNPPLDAALLREQFLNAPPSETTRWIAIAASLALAAFVLWLVRSRRLREEYSPIWIAVAVSVLALSLSTPLLQWLARAIGAWTLSSTLFFFGQLFLVAICLQYAVRLSKLSGQVKELAQQVTLLRAEVEESDDDPA